VKAAGWSVPGQMRLFSNADRAEAEAWVSEGLVGGRQGPLPPSPQRDSPG
jgi:hypothetical protein